MKRVAVIAHSRKSIGGGLPELRRRLDDRDGIEVMWHEVPKSAKAGKRARAAAKEGADLVLVWGGDGSVQQCIDALAGTGVTLAIIPAGTANLFATNLGVPSSHRRSARHRRSTAGGPHSTPVSSTVSTSPSCPARASTLA